MNKIFKVIWSKSKQCYIVVSEMAKNHSGKKKIVVASILAAMAVGTEITAIAISEGPTSANSVSLGVNSSSYGGTDRYNPNDKDISSVSIGNTARTNGAGSIAIGANAESGYRINGYATSDVNYGIAIGRTAASLGDYGVSVGYKTRSVIHSIAMGEQARAIKDGATTFGVSSRGYGKGAIAVGWQALAGADIYNNGVPDDDINNDTKNGTATKKKIDDYDKWGDVAIGIRTVATGGNATALGRGATASAANAIAIGGGDGGEPTKDGNKDSDNKERTKATAEKAVAIGYKAESAGVSATALGTGSSATKVDAIAVGTDSEATEERATAIGKGANAEKSDTVAIGTGAISGGTNGLAVGNDA